MIWAESKMHQMWNTLTLYLPEEPLAESLLSGLIVILYHIPVQVPPFLVKFTYVKYFFNSSLPQQVGLQTFG